MILPLKILKTLPIQLTIERWKFCVNCQDSRAEISDLKNFEVLEQFRHQIDLEKYENVCGGLLNDSIIENLENIAKSAHNWLVKIFSQLPR